MKVNCSLKFEGDVCEDGLARTALSPPMGITLIRSVRYDDVGMWL